MTSPADTQTLIYSKLHTKYQDPKMGFLNLKYVHHLNLRDTFKTNPHPIKQVRLT